MSWHYVCTPLGPTPGKTTKSSDVSGGPTQTTSQKLNWSEGNTSQCCSCWMGGLDAVDDVSFSIRR